MVMWMVMVVMVGNRGMMIHTDATRVDLESIEGLPHPDDGDRNSK